MIVRPLGRAPGRRSPWNPLSKRGCDGPVFVVRSLLSHARRSNRLTGPLQIFALPCVVAISLSVVGCPRPLCVVAFCNTARQTLLIPPDGNGSKRVKTGRNGSKRVAAGRFWADLMAERPPCQGVLDCRRAALPPGLDYDERVRPCPASSVSMNSPNPLARASGPGSTSSAIGRLPI